MATIHQAAGRGALPLVRRYLDEAPELVNARDKNGRTPLMHACQWGAFPVVSYLLDHGAHVNKVDYSGSSALQWTAPTGASLRTIALLLERGADPSLKLPAGCRLDEGEEDDEEMQQEAAPPAAAGASGAGHRSASPYYQHHRHLRGGATFLMRACSYGYDQVLRLLLRHGGSDLDARDGQGRAALHYACETGKAGAARLLLDAGADPFLADADGRTALDVARMWDRHDCARVLEDWMKAYHLYRLRRTHDAVDAVTHGTPRQPPRWLLHRVREGRPLPRVEILLDQRRDKHQHQHQHRNSSGGSGAGLSCSSSSSSSLIAMSLSLPLSDGAAADASGGSSEPSSKRCRQQQRQGSSKCSSRQEEEKEGEEDDEGLAAARAQALGFAVALPGEIFRELMEGFMGLEMGALCL